MSVQQLAIVMLMQIVKIFLVHTGVLANQDMREMVSPVPRKKKLVSCFHANFGGGAHTQNIRDAGSRVYL